MLQREPSSGVCGMAGGAGSIGDAWRAPVDDFKRWMLAGGKPPTTIRLYLHYVSALAALHPAGPWQLGLDDLVMFLASGHGWSPDARKSARTAMRAFYLWAWTSGRVAENPARDLPAISIPRRRARPADEDAIAAALAQAARRERTMILLGRYAGLRCCEIAAVHSDDIEGTDLYVTGKGGHQRVVPLTPELAGDLATYPAGFVFPGAAGGHMTPGHVSRLLSRALGAHRTAHMLRHRFATAMVDAGASVEVVKELLGHESITTTMTYVELNRRKLRGAILAGAVYREPVEVEAA